jgi:hypothetical protein
MEMIKAMSEEEYGSMADVMKAYGQTDKVVRDGDPADRRW